MFHVFTPPKCGAILAMIVLGIASQKQATAAPPELINLYFAEQNRSHCDHLVVAILQGTIPSTKSKEGVVVNMFPPGNDGTRTDTGGGKPSGSVAFYTKNLPKEGLVIDLFPPGNDGTRTDTGGGKPSGSVAFYTKNLPKEGLVINMFPPGNTGTRTDTGGGTGSGGTKSLAISHNTVRSNRGTRTDTGGGTGSGDSTPGAVSYSSSRSNRGSRTDTGGGTGSGGTKSLAINHNSVRSNRGSRTDTGGGTGSGGTKSLAINHNTVRSNRGTRTDTGGGTGSGDSTPGAVSYSSSRSNPSSSTDLRDDFARQRKDSQPSDTDEGDLLQKSDVVQCEHCGASCTEPCRCNPSGIGLIFGATDDQLGMMQYEEGFSYITYQTSYGMRAVTLISMGPDSNQILAIAKGWKQDDDCHQDHQQRPPVSVDPNPYAEVGVAHNRTLDYLTPDLNLTLLNLRQGNDKVVRKKPGRTSFGNITLQRADRNAPSDELLYVNSCLFMSQIYRLHADWTVEVLDISKIAEDGYGSYQDFQNRLSDKDPSKRAFQQLEETILLSPDLKAFNRAIDQQVVETMFSREYDNDQRSLLLGSLSLAKGTVAYWNAQDDIFDGDIIERGNGKFWADLCGFVAGFTGTLINNNNNGGQPDQNAFTNGTALGAGASAAVGDKDEP